MDVGLKDIGEDLGGLKSWVLRDFWVLKCFRVLLERKEEKMKSTR